MGLDSFFLGINSSDNVEIFPRWDYKKTKRQINSKVRKADGDGTIYKFGDFDHVTIKIENVSFPNRNTLNGYWNDGKQLLFWVNSGGVSEVNSVILVNPSTPIGKINMPYSNQYGGKLILTGY